MTNQNHLPVFILCIPLILLASGCATKEVHLWPILDVAPDPLNDSDQSEPQNTEVLSHGSRVRALWPIFELDTTGSAAKHAVRPIYSYNGEDKEGSVFWPLVRFGFKGEDDHFFHLFPLYFNGRKGGKSWNVFFPLAGKLDGQKTGNWLFIFPYINREQGDKHFRGVVVPPLIFGKDAAADSKWGLILNYFYSEKPGESLYTFFPFFIKRSKVQEKPPEVVGAKTSRETVHDLFVLPFYYHHSVENESQQLESDFYLGPLYQRSLSPGYQKRAFGLVPWINFDEFYFTSILGWSSKNQNETEKKSLEIFPFYSTESDDNHYEHALPGLGLYRWSHQKTHMGVRGANRGWAWWPLFGIAQGFDNDSREPNGRSGWRALAGLLRYSKNISQHNLSLLFPLHEVSGNDKKQHHRFWPLYRYSSSDKKTEFSALAEIFASRKSSELTSDFRFLLHPISYQGIESGDYDFRFLWKLIEARSAKGESIKAFNPFFYSRSTPDESRTLFMGGLFGWGRDGEDRFTRVFWGFNFPRP
jgi:hypothetical protein